MKRIIFILFLVSLVFKAWCQPPTAFEMNERLGRGINMGNAFEAPTESAWGNPWRSDYFRIISELGFSHVRIPIRWSTPARTMPHDPYTIDPSFLKRIQRVVNVALDYNLHPVINVHHYEELFEDPEDHIERFLAIWSQIAAAFQNYPDSLVFEVLNEPHNNLSPALWNELFAKALSVIRETNPTRTVLMGTAEYGGLRAVTSLKVPDDPHLILSVHYYNPFEFTHQGANWVGDGSRAWIGTQWYDTQEERDKIINEFQNTIKFARDHNLPIHVGEFGAYSSADLSSRVRWTSFLARWFEQQGFSWAYWEFSAGFGIYNPISGEFNEPLKNALLHNPLPEPTTFASTLIFEHNFKNNTDNWKIYLGGDAEAILNAVNGNLELSISNPGTQIWHVQLIKPGITIEKGALYRVTFKARSQQNVRHMSSYIGKDSNPWNAYSTARSVALTETERNYSYTFTMNSETDTKARLVFDLGLSKNGVLISNVKIEKLSIQNKK
jgi:endoglucanase